MANVKVLLWFDVEDYITPESEEALLGLLNLLDSRGIKGIFKLVGEKARRLEEHKRLDILTKLSAHEVGYHTDYHSQHPTLSEYLEHVGFREGADEFAEQERAGLDDVRRITGKPILSYGQPGGAWAAQVFPVLKQWDIPVYMDSHDQITLDGKPFWYGGILNITHMYGTMRMELVDGGLDEAKKKFDDLYASQSSESVGFVSIFYHPCEFVTTDFWDSCNFERGKNTPREQWRTPPLRQPAEMEHYLGQLGAFLDYTMTKENVEYITTADALRLESSASDRFEAEDVRVMAAQVGEKLYFTVRGNSSLSASDLLSLFIRYTRGEELRTDFVYGPERHVVSDTKNAVKVSDVKSALATDYSTVCGYKQWPDYFTIAQQRVNPVDMACTLARIIAHDLQDDDELSIVEGNLASQMHAKDNADWGAKWIIFPEPFKVPNLIDQSKLQTWTLKPALF